MTVKEVTRIGRAEALALEDRAKKGNPHAMTRFYWYAAWQKLCHIHTLTPRAREEAFLLLQKKIKLVVIPHGNWPNG